MVSIPLEKMRRQQVGEDEDQQSDQNPFRKARFIL
jgi:hypothetical protein